MWVNFYKFPYTESSSANGIAFLALSMQVAISLQAFTSCNPLYSYFAKQFCVFHLRAFDEYHTNYKNYKPKNSKVANPSKKFLIIILPKHGNNVEILTSEYLCPSM